MKKLTTKQAEAIPAFFPTAHCLRAMLALLLLTATSRETAFAQSGKAPELPSSIALTMKGGGIPSLALPTAAEERPAPGIGSLACPSPVTNVLVEPRLRPGLMINLTVSVAGRKEIQESNKRVSDDGQVNLPLIGNVSVRDMTLKDLSARLTSLYSTYLRSPQIDLGFAFDNSPGSMSPWGSVTVLGRVRNEGSINIPPTQDLTVSRAIQQAGGFNTSANFSSIVVTRRNPDGSVRHMEVDLRALRSRGELGQDMKLEAGDVVFVPEQVF